MIIRRVVPHGKSHPLIDMYLNDEEFICPKCNAITEADVAKSSHRAKCTGIEIIEEWA
jgi:hypothetical protein